MTSTYYLGQTISGRIVSRASKQDYGYTHGAIDGNGRTSFGTSLQGCRSNADGLLQGAYEVAEVRVVDRRTYMAATKPQPLVEPLKPGAVSLSVDHMTREAWMVAFVDACRPVFEQAEAPLPDAIRVSIGHPSKGTRSNVIGECWSNASSQDGAVEIFIRPTLQSDASRVADVLTHELIHAALGNEEGHGAGFRRVMKRLGLEGKATATVAGAGWHEWADPLLEALGPLPGAQLNDGRVLVGGKKTQTTRYLKVSCTMCDWTARVTAKHLEGRTLHCPDSACEGELTQEGSLGGGGDDQ